MAGANPRNVGNLPDELSSFIGRRRQLGKAKRLLGESRLVTLTGVGGTGKTRLALRAAADLRRAFGDGVWFVDLTALQESGLLDRQPQDPDVLAYLVTATLGLRQQDGEPPLQWLAEQLADRQMLLVLDNCEHLIPASAILTHTLLHGCPRLRVLATSREPLAIAGETLFAVPPLPVPDPRQRPSLADTSRCEAVVLFLARAQAVAPEFALTEDNHVAVAHLCHRLDGLPLAIELAAARVRVLTPAQILERLADRFALLSRGSRSAPLRQRTLRGCVDWSFDLCAKPERVLWARLSVFVGGFELDAVEGVCADETLPAEDLLDLVTGLLDKSIIGRDNGHGEQARYRMLETIRDYGQEQLIEAEEQTTLRRRHRDWYQQLAAQANAEWLSERQAYWYPRLIREHPNLRAAIEFCLADPDQAEAALRIVLGLPLSFWWSRGVVGEGLSWLERALAQVTEPTVLRARALVAASGLTTWHGDRDTMTRRLVEAEHLAQRLQDPVTLAFAGYVRAAGALWRNDPAGTIEFAEQGLTDLSAAPEPELALRVYLLHQVGLAAGLGGDYDRARRCHEEIQEITEPRGEKLSRSYSMWVLGLAAWRAGDVQEAGHQVREGLLLRRTAGLQDPYLPALMLEVLACVAARQGRYRRAATVLGAADALWTERGQPITSVHMLIADHEACERQTRDALGDAAYDEAFRHGQALTYDDALAYALDERRQPTPPPRSDTSTLLTRRERQIADLVAQGLSNKEIATSLVISQRTAESHVEHILTKLGFTSRAQIAAWTAEQRPPPTPG